MPWDKDDQRPSPDRLLSLMRRDQGKVGRGHLKVFLGMVAGVGKTFSMLQRAHQLKSQGEDVVIGWVDTHGRRETEALVHGLERIAPLKLTHRGVELEEMDLDAILARKPKVVIVDELAHTNAPGLRHEKRYADVLELLKAGIDVFTAVNIQHVESRVDTVKEITGVSVQETVPDFVLDEADEIALIDLPPEDLLHRLREGRIYRSEKAEAAAKNFFTRGNLTALRELALRAASDRVDRDLRDFKTLHGIDQVWKSSSRLMVAVFGSPYSDSLIRWTRQLADTMKGTWIGVYVDTGRSLGEAEKKLLEKNTELVRQLGGEFFSVQDDSLVEGVLRIAREQNATQIIVGKTQRAWWKNWMSGGSIVHQLLKASGDIDVYAVATDRGRPREHRQIQRGFTWEILPWGELGWVLGGIFAAWFFAASLQPLIGYESIGVVFLMAVTLSGVVLSRPSVLLMAVLLSLIHNFFFIPPLHTFSIDKPQDFLMFLMYFLAAATVGHLTTRLKKQNRLIQSREDKTLQLFKLAHAIAEAKDLGSIVALGGETLGKTFNAEVGYVFFNEDGTATPHVRGSFFPDAKEMAVAQWVRVNGTTAGRFTDTLPSAAGTYFPIQTKQGVTGAVAIHFPKDSRFGYEQQNFAHAMIAQLNAGVEREQLHESQRRLEVLEQADRLYRSLFDSVSHELKTPLTTIKGAASALHSNPDLAPELSNQIETETQRLLEVVDNMLDMTRIESGALKPAIAVVDVADILGPALKKLGDGAGRVEAKVAPGLPGIRCDAALTVQALMNILRNAVVYSGESKIEITVSQGGSHTVVFRVRDHGPGLPKDDPSRVFTRFYRQHSRTAGGVGLGLSIAKGFIESQGGTIVASNAPDGTGALFTLALVSE